jgi:hypothetical protein
MLTCPIQEFNEIVGSIDFVEHVCFGFGTVQIFHYVQIIRLEFNPEAIENKCNSNYRHYCHTDQNFGSLSQALEAIHLN